MRETFPGGSVRSGMNLHCWAIQSWNQDLIFSSHRMRFNFYFFFRCLASKCRGIYLDDSDCKNLYETNDVPESDRNQYNQVLPTSNTEDLLINGKGSWWFYYFLISGLQYFSIPHILFPLHFTAGKRSLRMLCFHRYLPLVHRGGGVCHNSPPPWPEADTPRADTPLSRHPPQ